uniref:Potassium channel domain-containing protein n=1 Tax=Timema cristinae TaxID=61476 RepID=A0A7R9GQ49_TIMCR|nr:unnamed protein product [Timema cristinae]
MGMQSGHQQILPPPIVPSLYQDYSDSSNSDRSNSPSPPILIKSTNKICESQQARKIKSFKTIFEHEIYTSSNYAHSHSNLKCSSSKGLIDFNNTASAIHCNFLSSQIRNENRSKTKSKNKSGHYMICCENEIKHIPGAVIENCNHNTQIYLKVLSHEPFEHKNKSYNLKDKNYVAIYMSKDKNKEDSKCDKPPPPEKQIEDPLPDSQKSDPPKTSARFPKLSRNGQFYLLSETDKKNSSNNFSHSDMNSSGNFNMNETECLNSRLSMVEESPFYVQSPSFRSIENEKENLKNSRIDLQGDNESPQRLQRILSENSPPHGCDLDMKNVANQYSSVGIQVSPSPQYRLRFLPICGCTTIEESNDWEFCGVEGLYFLLRLAGRWVLSQCGLTVILFLWALLGAAAFEATEGPREEEQMRDLRRMQSELAVELSTELRLVKQERYVWRDTVQKYMAKHEGLLLEAVSAGYGEGGGGGKIWSYAGCLLFAVSLLTTLGFGAPVPRTTLGRLAAVIFSAIGIPLHLILVLNIGMLVAVKLQSLALKWQPGTSLHSAMFQCCCHYTAKKHKNERRGSVHAQVSRESSNPPTGNEEPTTVSRSANTLIVGPFIPPRWLKWLPAVSIATYYLAGVLMFGVGRSRSLSDCLLFPLDFTAAGGVGLTPGCIRIFYAMYLEGAVALAAITVAILQVSAAKGMTELGLKLGLLTNS